MKTLSRMALSTLGVGALLLAFSDQLPAQGVCYNCVEWTSGLWYCQETPELETDWGYYQCDDTGPTCSVSEPGCGGVGPGAFAPFTGTVRLSRGPVHGEDTFLRRGCFGIITERYYSSERLVDIRAATAKFTI